MSKQEPTTTPQRGRLVIHGRKAIQFWIRAFQMEREIENVRTIVDAKVERKTAAVPIIAEYELDENLKFIFIISAIIDVMGIKDGAGVIYWCSDPKSEKEAFRQRDKFADDLIGKLEKHKGFDEVIEMDVKRER